MRGFSCGFFAVLLSINHKIHQNTFLLSIDNKNNKNDNFVVYKQ